MANSRFYQFLYSKEAMLTYIHGKITFGATGAVSATAGKGVTSFTRQTTGLYLLRLSENYNAFLNCTWTMQSGVTGSNVSDGSFTVNTPYQIVTPGTVTNWSAVGLSSQVTAAAGSFFVASASGTAQAGGGTAKAITTTGVANVEVCQNAQIEVAPSVTTPGTLLLFQTLDFAGALVDPANGSQLGFDILLRNSSVTY